MQSKKRVEIIKSEVFELEKKKMELSQDLTFQKTPAFIEQEARNKLNMVKPNEEVFVIDENLDISSNKSAVLSSATTKETEYSKKQANLYSWIKLLF